jgi:hypothetical protein
VLYATSTVYTASETRNTTGEVCGGDGSVGEREERTAAPACIVFVLKHTTEEAEFEKPCGFLA